MNIGQINAFSGLCLPAQFPADPRTILYDKLSGRLGRTPFLQLGGLNWAN